MKKLMVLLFLLLIPIGFSQNTYQNCIDNTTLQQVTSLVLNNNSVVVQENLTCTFGCDSVNNLCNSDPFYISLYTIIGFVVFFGVILWIYKKARG